MHALEYDIHTPSFQDSGMLLIPRDPFRVAAAAACHPVVCRSPRHVQGTVIRVGVLTTHTHTLLGKGHAPLWLPLAMFWILHLRINLEWKHMWNYQYWNSAEFYVNMASQDSLTSETCVLGSLCYCGSDVSHPVSGRILGSKGLATLIDVSRKRGDGLYNDIIAGQSYFIHNKCYKTYTAARNIALAQRGSVKNSAAPALRSQQNIFRYETHCLICATEIDFQYAKKYPGSKHDISQTEIVNRDGKSIIQNTLLSLCELRTDAHALEVKSCIQYAGDIRAVEAKYHRWCMQRFLVTKTNSNTETENVASAQDHLNDLAFHEICNGISADGETGKQFTMATLHARLKDYLPDVYEPYTRKHPKRHLQEHFQGNITIADLDGKAIIITLAERATEILHESYAEAEGSTEFDKMVRELGSVIHQDLLNSGYWHWFIRIYSTSSPTWPHWCHIHWITQRNSRVEKTSPQDWHMSCHHECRWSTIVHLAITALCWIVHSSNHKITHFIGCPVIFGPLCTILHSHGLSAFCCTWSKSRGPSCGDERW